MIQVEGPSQMFIEIPLGPSSTLQIPWVSGKSWSLWTLQVAQWQRICQWRSHRRQGFNAWVGKIPWRWNMATHSSILAWEIPWTKELSRPQSMESQRVGHDWETEHLKSPDGIAQVLASDKFTLLTCVSFKLVRYHCFNKINSLVLLVQDNILELEVWSMLLCNSWKFFKVQTYKNVLKWTLS